MSPFERGAYQHFILARALYHVEWIGMVRGEVPVPWLLMIEELQASGKGPPAAYQVQQTGG